MHFDTFIFSLFIYSCVHKLILFSQRFLRVSGRIKNSFRWGQRMAQR